MQSGDRCAASRDGFITLMNRLAEAWEQGDARQAAGCFTDAARYGDLVRRGLARATGDA